MIYSASPDFKLEWTAKGRPSSQSHAQAYVQMPPPPKKYRGFFLRGGGVCTQARETVTLCKLMASLLAHHACSQSTVTQKKKETARSLKSGLQGFVSVS